MTDHAAELDRILGPCTCIDAYKGRQMVDPSCMRCQCEDEVIAVLDERDLLKKHLSLVSHQRDEYHGLLVGLCGEVKAVMALPQSLSSWNVLRFYDKAKPILRAFEDLHGSSCIKEGRRP